MKYFFGLVFSLVFFFESQAQKQRVTAIIEQLKNPKDKNVLVIAHRADWRNSPENSIAAINNAIELGVDIVEIDVQKTKDGHLIIMHDEKVDRTTNGKGYVKDYTLDSLKKLFLRNGMGRVTYHKVPTLEEAMLAVKGKVMVNLDKCYEHLNEAYAILEKTGTVNHAIFKGYYFTPEQVKKDYGHLLDKIFYMAMVRIDEPGSQKIIDDFQTLIKPVAFELSFKNDTSSVINQFEKIKERGSRVWINSLWASLNGGHDDDRSETDIAGSYGWIVGKGTNMIQTDRPKQLLLYLKARHLHP